MPLATCASCGGNHRCPESDCAKGAPTEEMAQLVAVVPPGSEAIYQYQRRQMPFVVEGKITMVLELPDVEQPTCDHSKGKSKSQHAIVDAFREKCSVLDRDELAAALMVPSKEMFGQSLQDCVPCVGCRRSMEEMFTRLRNKRHVRVLEPLVITPNSELSVTSCTLYDVRLLHNILYTHRTKLDNILETLQKNKKSRRCQLHSLDSHKTKQISVWMDVWQVMKQACREEITIVPEAGLMQTTEGYLQKHRFCTDCKAKVMTAFSILFGDIDPCCEKGYNPVVYEGLRLCREERHVHLSTETDFIARLISRAEPDLNGVRRERHAKTVDIAQEEVLTCLGLHLYDRLQKIHQKLMAEEQTWRLLLYVGMNRLQKSFEMALESKEGMSKLEIVCEEINEADRAKREKKEQKKQRRKARKKNKAGSPPDSGRTSGCRTAAVEEVEVRVIPQERSCECEEQQADLNENKAVLPCNECSLAEDGSVLHAFVSADRCDGDYSSGVECGEECNHSSRESSEVACSEGMCNHDWGQNDDMQGEDVDRCAAVDEICADCEVAQGEGQGDSVRTGRGKCSGGQPLAKPLQHNGEDDVGNSQVRKICQCANEDQLRRAVGWTHRLQDMLTEQPNCHQPDEEEDLRISQEDIRNFQAKHKTVSHERQQLRAQIQQRFYRRFKGLEGSCAVDYRLSQLAISID
ncbi:gametogenetin-binding protein 2-like [Diadema setosum]|uniref:gametogenetin-binding protein 2-like n=1 Tax=Diadema setosum TaxID=31175 RepID=UPI003B3AE437